jgi:hypothetical protein
MRKSRLTGFNCEPVRIIEAFSQVRGERQAEKGCSDFATLGRPVFLERSQINNSLMKSDAYIFYVLAKGRVKPNIKYKSSDRLVIKFPDLRLNRFCRHCD